VGGGCKQDRQVEKQTVDSWMGGSALNFSQ